MNKEEFDKKFIQKVKIDESLDPKTTIKPSEKEIAELKEMWEKFHKELLDKLEKQKDKPKDKKSEE